MVTIVLLVIWECGTEPEHKHNAGLNEAVRKAIIHLAVCGGVTSDGVTYCRRRRHGVGRNDGRHGCRSDWCDGAEDGLLR